MSVLVRLVSIGIFGLKENLNLDIVIRDIKWPLWLQYGNLKTKGAVSTSNPDPVLISLKHV